MTISQVNVGDIVTAAKYNEIQSTISSVLVAEYGNSTLSTPVTVGTEITADQWSKLYTDISRCRIHQSNLAITLSSAVPVQGAVIYANFANDLITAANSAYTNRAVANANQFATRTSTSTRTTGWGTSGIKHRVLFTWDTAADAQYFFNLGGELKFNLTYPSGSYSGLDATWTSFITASASGIAAAFFNKTDYGAGLAILYNNNSGDENIVITGATQLSGRQVQIDIDLEASGLVNLDVTGTVTEYRSMGNLGPSPYGVAAPTPIIDNSITFNNSSGAVTNTKTLKITPTSLNYSLNVNNASSTQVVTLTNNGNSNLTVSSITYTTNGGVGVTYNYTPWNTFPVTINSGSFKTFTLGYVGGPTAGTFNNSFTVYSDNDNGAVTVPTTLVVAAQPFAITISPTTWNISWNSALATSQSFTINATGEAFTSGNYTYTWITTYTGFSVTKGGAGPIIKFDPTSPSSLASGTYVGVLSVTATSVNGNQSTTTIPVSVNYTSTVSATLGWWLSPRAGTNAIVGMSYDLIGGQRYLTIGVGLGEDGCPYESSNPTLTGAFVSIANLGFSGDSEFLTPGTSFQQPVLYEMEHNGNQGNFILTYGSWVRTKGDIYPTGVWQYRNFYFSAPSAGTYNWEISADNSGDFRIDGQLIKSTSGTFGSSETGTMFLTAGLHALTIGILNNDNGKTGTQNPGGMGLRISTTSNQEIWSTIGPRRSTAPYQYWTEVYRFPILVNSFPTTYQSYFFCIKDGGRNAGYRYGDAFGSSTGANNRSLFTVVNDGVGNLSINFNNPTATITPSGANTVYNLQYLPYYYSPNYRYLNLETPATGVTTTKYFQGFNKDGVIQTTIVPYPSKISTTNTGGGCPAPWHKILLSSGQLINAGELQVGMQVRTQHEHTLEWGNYSVTFVQIQQQERMEILFDHCRFICSTTHKFHLQGSEWREATDIKVGDIISGYTVKEVNHIENGDVVKITVDDAHTYICEGMLSHNKINVPNDNFIFNTNYV